ncbi:MAG TPA: hypothetical protein PK430_05490 [Muribaculum sp.]|uniref:Uncharacterized protein n=1 Tax=Heminiphilus faecis TaxID=2601703 RepID=A0ABV4CVG7_9BACT|nr:hypothetical protein [Heminiphilus faecis]RLT76066.1 hypothetical protein D7V95_10325 [bacterium J10(2018)]HRF68661.1 hypothetical protein [Muribaculum sp.]
MSAELFFWVTISSLLLTMILFFRKSLVQDFVSMSTVIVFYAAGTFGNIYNHLFFLAEDALLYDALYLLIVMSIIMGAQVMSELLVNMVVGELNIKVMALNIGEIILSWIGIYIIIYLYLLLWEYSTPIICSLIIPCGIFFSALSRVISDKDFKDADDYLTIYFVSCIFLFGGLWWFNTLIGRPEIIRAFGIYSQYYSTAASLIPAIMLCLPFIIGLSKIRVSNLLNKIEDDDNNKASNQPILVESTKNELNDEECR